VSPTPHLAQAQSKCVPGCERNQHDDRSGDQQLRETEISGPFRHFHSLPIALEKHGRRHPDQDSERHGDRSEPAGYDADPLLCFLRIVVFAIDRSFIFHFHFTPCR
jgi:hypothetical protein